MLPLKQFCSYLQGDPNLIDDLILPDVPTNDFTSSIKSTPTVSNEKKTPSSDANKRAIEIKSIEPKKPSPLTREIKAMDFYNLIKENKDNLNDILAIDVRSSEEYAQAKINHPCTINIPKAFLQPGANINSVDRKINKQTWPTWYSKTEKKFIAIFDDDLKPQNIGDVDIKSCAGIILQDILLGFDSGYEILLVIGGFQQWHMQFPSLTTNPQYIKKVCYLFKNIFELF